MLKWMEWGHKKALSCWRQPTGLMSWTRYVEMDGMGTQKGIIMLAYTNRADILAVCHMNQKFTQTAGQVAHKSNSSCVVRAADIAMESYTIAIN